jgi:hypothetical protein
MEGAIHAGGEEEIERMRELEDERVLETWK